MSKTIVVETEGQAIYLAVALATASLNSITSGGSPTVDGNTARALLQLADTAVSGAFNDQDIQHMVEESRHAVEAYDVLTYSTSLREKEGPCKHCPCAADECCFCGQSKSVLMH